MKHAMASMTLGACLLFASAGMALATGQPGSTAGVQCTVSANAPLTPGSAGSATNPSGTNGSPFNQAIAKTYAGNPGSPTTSNGHASANAVSQYDVACKNVSSQVP
jgi:hypothetical protein